MQIVTVASAKGGSCKTVTAALIAVRAMQDGKLVAMLDLNFDQGSLSQWWITRGKARGKPINPALISDITNITRDVAILRASRKYDLLVIDTPPNDIDTIENAIVVADFIVVPVRTSIFDVRSVEAVASLCKAHSKAFAFLLAAADNRFKDLNKATLEAIADDGPILKAQISYRLAHMNALTVGKVGPEIDKALHGEADKLWFEIKALLDTARPARPLNRAAQDRSANV